MHKWLICYFSVDIIRRMPNSNRFVITLDKVLLLIYALVVLWWVSIFLRGIQETTENYAFSLAYTIMPLGWGILGFLNAHRWGGLRSSLGRGIMFLSTGLLAWAIGNLIFGYYNLVLSIPVPAPSLADFGFLLLYPLSAIGMAYFLRVTGATFAMKDRLGKLFLFIIPLVSLVVSYYLLFTVARGGEFDTSEGFLVSLVNIAYPLGDVAVITLAMLVYGFSRKYLGGHFKKPIVFILVGFVFTYIADFLFLYTVTAGTYYVGKWVDLFYPTAFLFISLGLYLLDPRLVSGRQEVTTSYNG